MGSDGDDIVKNLIELASDELCFLNEISKQERLLSRKVEMMVTYVGGMSAQFLIWSLECGQLFSPESSTMLEAACSVSVCELYIVLHWTENPRVSAQVPTILLSSGTVLSSGYYSVTPRILKMQSLFGWASSCTVT